MHTRKTFVALLFSRRNNVLFLAFFWVFGIITGMLLAAFLPDFSVSLMRAALSDRVSIVGLVVVLLAPLFLSAAAVHFSSPWIIHFVAATKGICYGFCIYVLLECCGSAGWLLRGLVFFSDSFMLIPLFLFWIRHINGSKMHLRHDTIRCVSFAVLLGAIDFLWISPFVVTMIETS